MIRFLLLDSDKFKRKKSNENTGGRVLNRDMDRFIRKLRLRRNNKRKRTTL